MPPCWCCLVNRPLSVTCIHRNTFPTKSLFLLKKSMTKCVKNKLKQFSSRETKNVLVHLSQQLCFFKTHSRLSLSIWLLIKKNTYLFSNLLRGLQSERIKKNKFKGLELVKQVGDRGMSGSTGWPYSARPPARLRLPACSSS